MYYARLGNQKIHRLIVIVHGHILNDLSAERESTLAGVHLM